MKTHTGGLRALALAAALVASILALAAGPLYAQSTATAASRVQWDQPGATEADLPLLTFRAFLDGAATGIQVTGVTCGGAGSAAGTFLCSGAFPPATPGKHSLQLAAYLVVNGAEIRSVELSAPLAFQMILAPGTPINLRIARAQPAEEHPSPSEALLL